MTSSQTSLHPNTIMFSGCHEQRTCHPRRHCPGLSAFLLTRTFLAEDLPPGRCSGHSLPFRNEDHAPHLRNERNAARWPPSAADPLHCSGWKSPCLPVKGAIPATDQYRDKKWLNAFLPTKDDSEETSELQTPTQQGTSWDLSWDCITVSFLLLPSPVSIHFCHTCWC